MASKSPRKGKGTVSLNAAEASPVVAQNGFEPEWPEAPRVSPFEAIKKTNEFGEDCWSSRELGRLLGYGEYRNFEPVINKAIEACINSGHSNLDHFVNKHEMISLGKGARRAISVVELSRYGAYLVIQNADPSKPLVAAGQTYFAVQTRRQELTDQEADQALEDQRRLVARAEMREHNLTLADAAKDAGVIEPRELCPDLSVSPLQ